MKRDKRLTQIPSSVLQQWSDEIDPPSYVSPKNDLRRGIRVIIARPSELSFLMKDKIFQLLERNMRELYEENWTWDPRAKRAELENSTSRFLLATSTSSQPTSVRRTTRHSATEPTLMGFIMWRFEDYDAVADDVTCPPGEEFMEVAYWYVLQT